MPNQDKPLVYFFGKSNFGDDQTDFIKIGHTRNDLSIRQAALQTGNEARISEMGVIPFNTVDEATREEERIKYMFGAFRAQGEWLYATPRIIQYIEDYAVQHTALLTDDPPPPENTAGPSFGKQLRNRRKDAKIKVTELAAKVDCTPGYIYFIENDWGRPGKRIRKALVDLFGEFDCPTPEPESDTEEANG